MDHSKKMQQSLSRREALRALAATGGAAALSTLPDKWRKPVVRVGTLPAFAQGSPVPDVPPTISNVTVVALGGLCPPPGGRRYQATYNYTAPSGGITAGQARNRVTFQFSSGRTSSQEEALDPANIQGDQFKGAITIPLCIDFGNSNSVILTFTLIDAKGQQSASETATVTP